MKHKVAVLMTCFNRKSNTLSCLNALKVAAVTANTDYDVFLVDDGSTDGTSEAVKIEFPEVKVLQGSGSLYWGGGMRKAWDEAAKFNYGFYLWLNDDTYLKPDSLNQLFADSAKFNDRAIISGVCEAEDSDEITYSGYLMKDKVRLKPVGEPVKCDFFNGNVLLVPAVVFDKTGNLDAAFPHSLGDIDYGLRAKKMGFESYISSKVVGKCDRHSALPKWCNPQVPFKERKKFFKLPLTKSPKQVYIFEKRHTSLIMALFRSNIIYIRLLFPGLWIKMGKAKI